MQIEDSPTATKVTPTPTPQHQFGMPLLPLVHVEATKVAQENIFSTLSPLHTLPTFTIIDDVQGRVN